MKYSRKFTSVIKARQALLLFVPAASIGVTMATYISPGIVGKICFTITKIWLVVFPIVWRLIIEKKAIKIPKVTKKEIDYGLLFGLIMSVIIVAAYWFVGKKYLDIIEVREQAKAVGITQLNIYLLAVMYWSFVNSLIEECVWRGFVYRHCRILQPRLMAIITSAAFFTLHHVIGLFFYLQNPFLAIIGSFGVFVAGIIWSACYQKLGFYTCYISHILADLAIGFVGWHLLLA